MSESLTSALGKIVSGTESGGNRPYVPISTEGTNMGGTDRLINLALGTVMVAWGLHKGFRHGWRQQLVGANLVRRAVTGHSYVYQFLGVSTADASGSPTTGATDGAVAVTRSITVGKSVEETYRRWRDPETFARSMAHLADITSPDPDHAHWTLKLPLGRSIGWDAQVAEERPNEFTRWESLPGADLPNESEVSFKPAPGARGTEITFTVRFTPPGGEAGHKIAELANAIPGAAIAQGMRRFKSLVETGEIPTNESPSARASLN